MGRLTEARDKEMYTLRNDTYSESFGYTIFKNRMLLLLRCHMEGEEIVNYFSWSKMSTHSRKRPIRLSSVVDMNKKKKLTVDAVIGNNIQELRENTLQKTKLETRKRKSETIINSWDLFWNDMIFLSELRSIAYYDRDSQAFQTIQHRIYNQKAISNEDNYYFVGFPDKVAKKSAASSTGKQTGDIRILEYDWIEANCDKAYILK